MRCGPSWKAASDEKQLEAESLEVSGAFWKMCEGVVFVACADF